MECYKVKELLPFVDDGSLEPAAVAEVMEHLETCTECRMEYTEIRSVVSMVKDGFASPELQPSFEFLTAVRQKIDHKKRERKVSLWALSAAAVVIIAINISLYGLQMRNNSAPGSYDIVTTVTDQEFYDYIAEQYFDAYELYELSSVVGAVNESYPEEMLMYYDSFHLTLDDLDSMFETVDEF